MENLLNEVSSLMEMLKEEHDHQIRGHIKESIFTQLEAIEAKLCFIEDNFKNSSITGDYLNKIQEKYIEVRDIANRLDDQFMLFVMGSGKNGKSTLINALLEQERAAVNFLPKTWKIDIFYDSSMMGDVEAIVRYKDGRSGFMSQKDANIFLEEEETKQQESQKKIRKSVREFKESHSFEEIEEFKKQQMKYKLYKSPVSEVIWSVSNSKILNDYCLVDTPGLNQELEGDIVISSARDYYHKADGVIWLLPADKISGVTDKSEIEKLLEAYGKRADNIIAVIGKIDKVPGDLDAIIAEAKKLYGNIMSEFIPISALKAVNAQKIMLSVDKETDQYKNAMREYEESGVPYLIKYLKRNLYTNKTNIQIESKKQSIEEIYKDINQLINTMFGEIEKASSRYVELVNIWNKAKEDVYVSAEKYIKNVCKEKAEHIEQIISIQENELWELEGEERDKAIQKILEAEKLNDFFVGVAEHNFKKLNEVYQYYVKQSAFKEFPMLKENYIVSSLNQGKVEIEKLESLTDEDMVTILTGGALATGAAILLGPIGIFIGGLAFTGAGRSVAKWFTRAFSSSIASKVKKKMEEQFQIACENIMKEYTTRLRVASSNIDRVRRDSYAMLYGDYSRQDAYRKIMTNIQSLLFFEYEPLGLAGIMIGKREGKSL